MQSHSTPVIISNHSQRPKFYNRSQAKVFAETHYNMGYDLYKSILPKLSEGKTEDSWKLWPAFINISFSCEIILKLFYEEDIGNIAHGHKLYTDIYSKLKDDTKKLISDETITCMITNGSKDYNYTNFNDDLIKSENTFAYERYSFEMIPGNSHSLECSFLLSFAKTLLTLSSKLL